MFSNIQEIYDFSVTFMGLLEAAIESADEGKPAAIGECFEEMAEVHVTELNTHLKTQRYYRCHYTPVSG